MTTHSALIPGSYFLLRIPAQPIGVVDNLAGSTADELERLWADEAVNNALYVSSAGLHGQIRDYLGQHGWPLPPALLRPLLNYVVRMSTRATPFGLMAGCAVGRVAAGSNVQLAKTTHRYVVHRRLDMDCIARLVQRCVAYPPIRNHLRFFSNNSHYAVGDELRYLEFEYVAGNRRYFMSATPQTDLLMRLLDEATTGQTLDQLIAYLLADGYTVDESSAFVDQLIEQQVLVSELEPALTGGPMLAVLRESLATVPPAWDLVAALDTVAGHLTNPALSGPALRQHVADALAPYVPLTPDQHLIQTDLFINTTANELNKSVLTTIGKEIEQVLPLNRPRALTAFRAFVDQFQERYDQQEIPLCKALDGEFGVGYGAVSGGQTVYAPLIDGLTMPTQAVARQTAWGDYETLTLNLLTKALREGTQTVELTPGDLQPLRTATLTQLPASFYMTGNLLAMSSDDLDRGNFQFNLLAAGGPSAANLLGRFCAYSSELTTLVSDTLAEEARQQPDTLFAEIVHWPDDRLGNVLVRPALRPYEIPYMGRSAVPSDQQLPVSDLLVSVRADGRVLLRSKRYGKPVVPRLSTAHNYRNGLSVYQFLADWQHHETTLNLQWDWGVLQNQPFLPRITFQHLVLSRATWTLPVATLPLTSAEALATCLQTTHHVPRWVALAQADNELVFDLDTSFGQQMLFDEARRLATLRLVEWLATPDQCWVGDPAQRFVQELIIPFSHVAAEPVAATRPAPTIPLDLPRQFAPGSEWLYLKFYVGAYKTDQLLSDGIAPFVQQLVDAGTIELFFFVRYADPDAHVRLRLLSHQPDFTGPVLTQLNQWLAPYLAGGIVQRVQLDTYEREVERYGAATELSEQLFAADSLATLTYLTRETDPADRWQFGLQSCDVLLTDFGLSLDAKTTLLQRLQAQFLAEHHADAALRKQLNARYRSQQQSISHCLACPAAPELITRSAVNRPLAAAIRLVSEGATGQQRLESLLASYLHMSINRLFAASQRQQEMVMYHFLARHYESQQARLRRQP